MADKLISDLNVAGSVAADDLFEVQLSSENVTKQATLTKVTAVEAAARAAQDDVIEARLRIERKRNIHGRCKFVVDKECRILKWNK